MELIDREAFINYIGCIVTSPCETRQEQSSALNKQKYTVNEFTKELKRAPLIDAVEVRHGFWIDTGDYVTTAYGHLDIYKCSECGANITIDDHDSFCPACGCRMDGRRESEGT